MISERLNKAIAACIRLNEVLTVDAIEKHDSNVSHENIKEVGKYASRESQPILRSRMKNHEGKTMHVYRDMTKVGDNYGYSTFYVTEPSGKIHLELSTSYQMHPQTKHMSHIVRGLYSIKNNAVRASDVYKHLITTHNISLISDNYQSHGGSKVWDRLVNEPEIGSHVVREISSSKTKTKTPTENVKIPDVGNRAFVNWNIDPKDKNKKFMHSDALTRLVAYKKQGDK